MLWTWQTFDFPPPFHRVDRSKSDFFTRPACPSIRRAYTELDKLLSLPIGHTGQFIWCYTTDSWGDPWYDRYLWSIDAPEQNILAYVNGPIWEHLIGSKSVPRSLREGWERDLWSRQIVEERYHEEMARKEREYHESFPPREACLDLLLNPSGPGEEVCALVAVPVDTSWIRLHSRWHKRHRPRR